MSLILLILVIAAFVALGVFTALLARKVIAMDKNIHAAFSYVGDTVGGALARLNRVESDVGYLVNLQETKQEVPQAANDDIILFTAADEKWTPQGFGSWSRVVPTVSGIDFDDPNVDAGQLLPAPPNGRSGPFGWSY